MSQYSKQKYSCFKIQASDFTIFYTLSIGYLMILWKLKVLFKLICIKKENSSKIGGIWGIHTAQVRENSVTEFGLSIQNHTQWSLIQYILLDPQNKITCRSRSQKALKLTPTLAGIHKWKPRHRFSSI